MRTITEHLDQPSHVRISADDRDPKYGNSSHEYHLAVMGDGPDGQLGGSLVTIVPFQHGPLKEAGPNGITNEALLAVVIDRLQGFQTGPHCCRENAIALTKLQEAMHWLHARTAKRARRGIEGTNQK